MESLPFIADELKRLFPNTRGIWVFEAVNLDFVEHIQVSMAWKMNIGKINEKEYDKLIIVGNQDKFAGNSYRPVGFPNFTFWPNPSAEQRGKLIISDIDWKIGIKTVERIKHDLRQGIEYQKLKEMKSFLSHLGNSSTLCDENITLDLKGDERIVIPFKNCIRKDLHQLQINAGWKDGFRLYGNPCGYF